MGGRGASSGTSKAGNAYGTQYKTLLTVGSVKYVTKIDRNSETLMETMASGRIYAKVGGNEIQSIVYFDKSNQRVKQIDIDHAHKGVQPHVHRGYLHNEYDSGERKIALTTEEARMVDSILGTWDNNGCK